MSFAPGKRNRALRASLLRPALAVAIVLALSLAAIGAVRFWAVGVSQTDAGRAQAELSAMSAGTGLSGAVLEADVNGSRYFRSSLGPFATKAEAEAARELLRGLSWKDAWVLSESVQDASVGGEGEAEGSEPDAGPSIQEAKEPVRRVIKVGLSWLSLRSFLAGSDRPVRVEGTDLATGEALSIEVGLIAELSFENDGIRVRSDEKDPGRLMGSPLVISSQSGTIWLSDRHRVYRSDVEVQARLGAGLLAAANIIDVEEYLLSVLPSEIGGSSPAEAYKAQAVVARTEALSSAGRHQDMGWDLCDSTHCQVFKGMYGQSANAEVAKAVKATEGEVLMCGGAMVKTASFHSACGGVTEACEEIWGSKLVHLTSVRDNPQKGEIPDLRDEAALRKYITGGDKSDLCYGAYGYRWEATLDRKALDGRIKALVDNKSALLAGPSARKIPAVTKRTARGAALEITVPYGGNDYIIKGELNIRNLMGGSTVAKSGVFVIDELSPGGQLRISGAGYGHGVGMCQEGAKALAKLGRGYRDILAFYYRSSSVGRVY